MSEQLMILVAGPYRSGTNDDPVLIQRNVDAMEDMALAVFRRGHLPVLGEWFALPLLKHAGSKKIGDAVFDEIFHPDRARADRQMRRRAAHRRAVERRRRHGRDRRTARQAHLPRPVGNPRAPASGEALRPVGVGIESRRLVVDELRHAGARSAGRRSCRNDRGRRRGTGPAGRRPRPAIGRLSGVEGRKPIQKRWPSVFTSGNMVRTLASKALARRSSGGASRPGDLDRAGDPQPLLHRRDAEGTALVRKGRGERDIGCRQHHVIATLGFERHAHAQRFEQPERPCAGGNDDLLGRVEADIRHEVVAAALSRHDLHDVLGDHATACFQEQPMKRLDDPLRAHGVAVAGNQHAAPHRHGNAGEHLAQIVGSRAPGSRCPAARAACAPGRRPAISPSASQTWT